MAGARRICRFGWFFGVLAAGVTASAGGPAATEELQLAIETLRRQHQVLQQELQQREAQVRMLTESLAIARTESELFQRRWMEMEMRLQALGVPTSGIEGSLGWQRQLIETLRLLYDAEAEKQRYRDQLQALVEAASGGDIKAEIARARGLLEAATRSDPGGSKYGALTVGTLESARVLDVNSQLRVLVLDIGEEQGARVGMPFLVVRGDEVVAQVRLVEVRRRVSGAVIETMSRATKVKVGDVAQINPRG